MMLVAKQRPPCLLNVNNKRDPESPLPQDRLVGRALNYLVRHGSYQYDYEDLQLHFKRKT